MKLKVGKYKGNNAVVKEIEVRRIKGKIVECAITYVTFGIETYDYLSKDYIESQIRNLGLKFKEHSWD